MINFLTTLSSCEVAPGTNHCYRSPELRRPPSDLGEQQEGEFFLLHHDVLKFIRIALSIVIKAWGALVPQSASTGESVFPITNTDSYVDDLPIAFYKHARLTSLDQARRPSL